MFHEYLVNFIPNWRLEYFYTDQFSKTLCNESNKIQNSTGHPFVRQNMTAPKPLTLHFSNKYHIREYQKLCCPSQL